MHKHKFTPRMINRAHAAILLAVMFLGIAALAVYAACSQVASSKKFSTTSGLPTYRWCASDTSNDCYSLHTFDPSTGDPIETWCVTGSPQQYCGYSTNVTVRVVRWIYDCDWDYHCDWDEFLNESEGNSVLQRTYTGACGS